MPKKKKINKKDQNSKKRKRSQNQPMKKEKKKKGLPGSLHIPGACNVMNEEEEEYDLHQENEVTSDDFQHFQDISPNASEIRDPDAPVTKQMVGQAEEIINNLFNGDTGDFEEGEEYNPTEEEKEELEKLFQELENPQPAPPPQPQPSRSGRVRKLANKEWRERPTLDSLEGAKKYQPDYFQKLEERKPLRERRMKGEMMTLTLDDEVVKGKKYAKGETTTPQRATQCYFKTIKPREDVQEMVVDLAVKCSQIYVHATRLYYLYLLWYLHHPWLGEPQEPRTALRKLETTYREFTNFGKKSFPTEDRLMK